MKTEKRAPGRCALALAVGLAVASTASYAAGLGRITVQSALGQPLRAEIEVTSVSPDEAASLAVRLASAAAFRQANLDFNPALTGLRLTLSRRGDNAFVVRIASPNPVNEPYLDLLVELTSSTGRVLREYTVLLDPPALRASQEVVAPAAAPRAAAPAPAAAAAPSSPVAAPRPAAAPPAGGSSVEVRRGDTLGGIAEKIRPSSASLDQMLVALFRANPEAFIGENMNNLRAGSVLRVPDEQQVLATDAPSARREVAAQSADFARYRSRLAQSATPAGPGVAAAAGQGRITTRVEDASAAAPSGDQLKIAQGAAGSRAGDEAIARDRQLKELLDRVAELERTNQQLQTALQLQSKAGAQAQTAAESKAGTPAAPVAAPTPVAPTAVAPAPAPTAPATEPATAPPSPPAAAPPPPAAPAEPPKAAAPKAAIAEEPGFFGSLVGSNLPLLAGLGAAIAALVGVGLYRRRKSTAEHEDFDASGEAARGNSLFGQTGGRSVDTGAASTFNSSFIPAASQLDSTEVDPVAEADVYIAYGREEQAEDILKEALRLQPDRHPARVKLMEILARRGDKAGFAQHATELKSRTNGVGEDWERAVVMGRSLDPANAMFAGGAAAGMELGTRGPTTELRLGPTSVARGASTGGFVAPPATLGGEESSLDFEEKLTEPSASTVGRQPGDSVLSVDSQSSIETILPVDAGGSAAAPTTQAPKARPGDTVAPDLSDLEFESFNTIPAARSSEAGVTAKTGQPLKFGLDLPTAAPSKAPEFSLPDLDLSLPPAGPPTVAPKKQAETAEPMSFDFNLPGGRTSQLDVGTASGFSTTTSSGPRTRPAPLEDALARPSLLGDLGALPDGPTRLASNTDQATVPLIDFDLTGADLPLNTGAGRAGAPTGSPMASQMATKLDLARGYIDLGVKDGARELLEEVMRDGTREQRQAAVDLMKQIER